MPERKRSTDRSRDTDRFSDAPPTPDQAGRDQGRLARDIGTRDELRRAEQGRTGRTRATKKDEKGAGNLAGHDGTGRDRGGG